MILLTYISMFLNLGLAQAQKAPVDECSITFLEVRREMSKPTEDFEAGLWSKGSLRRAYMAYKKDLLRAGFNEVIVGDTAYTLEINNLNSGYFSGPGLKLSVLNNSTRDEVSVEDAVKFGCAGMSKITKTWRYLERTQ